jgi:hypothetical protein
MREVEELRTLVVEGPTWGGKEKGKGPSRVVRRSDAQSAPSHAGPEAEAISLRPCRQPINKVDAVRLMEQHRVDGV